MKPIHRGRILKRELSSRKLAANKLAVAIRVPSGRITRILNEKRGITGETAMRLSRYFGNSARFRLSLQSLCELAVAERDFGAGIDSEIGMSAQVQS